MGALGSKLDEESGLTEEHLIEQTTVTVTLRHPALKYITSIARILGFVLIIATWAIGIDYLVSTKVAIGIYLICLAPLISMLELSWILNKCACCGQEGLCCMLWRGIMFIDDWKRGVAYACLSIPCFIPLLATIITGLEGVLLIICGLAYIAKTFKYRITRTRKTSIKN